MGVDLSRDEGTESPLIGVNKVGHVGLARDPNFTLNLFLGGHGREHKLS